MSNTITILLGIQGSGKGVLGNRLRNIHNYHFIETGALFRELDRTTPLGLEIATYMESGILVPDNLTNDLVAVKLALGRDILFDGFPRNVGQARWLLDWAREPGLNVDSVLLNIPDELVIARIQHRIATKNAGRADDANLDAVARRVAEYHASTAPMIDFLRAQPGVRLFDIDATQTEEQVFADARGKLGV